MEEYHRRQREEAEQREKRTQASEVS